jgi:hypothetical protein
MTCPVTVSALPIKTRGKDSAARRFYFDNCVKISSVFVTAFELMICLEKGFFCDYITATRF